MGGEALEQVPVAGLPVAGLEPGLSFPKSYRSTLITLLFFSFLMVCQSRHSPCALITTCTFAAHTSCTLVHATGRAGRWHCSRSTWKSIWCCLGLQARAGTPATLHRCHRLFTSAASSCMERVDPVLFVSYFCVSLTGSRNWSCQRLPAVSASCRWCGDRHPWHFIVPLQRKAFS